MEIHLSQILFQVLNFAIIFYLLKRFVYKPVIKVLDERASKIQEGLEAADKNLNLGEELEASKEKILAKAKKEADDLVKQAKSEAQEILKKAEVDAKKEARVIHQKERQAFEVEMEQQSLAIKKQLTQLVTQATHAVLNDTIDMKLHSELLDKQIQKLSVEHTKI